MIALMRRGRTSADAGNETCDAARAPPRRTRAEGLARSGIVTRSQHDRDSDGQDGNDVSRQRVFAHAAKKKVAMSLTMNASTER